MSLAVARLIHSFILVLFNINLIQTLTSTKISNLFQLFGSYAREKALP